MTVSPPLPTPFPLRWTAFPLATTPMWGPGIAVHGLTGAVLLWAVATGTLAWRTDTPTAIR